MKHSIKGQTSAPLCVSCALLHIAIVIGLVIGFDGWFVWSVWFN